MKRPQAAILILAILPPADTGGSILAGETAGTDAVGTIPSTDGHNRVDYCGSMVYDRGERSAWDS